MVANGAAVNGVGHDVRANAVVVTTRGDQPEVEALFREALGEVVFEVGPLEASPIIGRANTATDPDALHSHGTGCNTRIDCNRWRGGIKMGQPGQNASMNMWAKRYNGSSWVYYIVFAGHADDDGGYYHNDVFVGLITRNSLWDATYENCDPIQWPTCRIETNSDSSRVFISSSAHEGLRNNWIYYESNSKAYELTYLHTSGMTAVGDPICKSGNGYWLYDSHTVCGKVISKNHHGVGQARCCADSQTIYINYLNRADFNGNYSGYGLAPGDSGAVVFSGAAGGWVGVAGPNTEGYFSRANKIEDDLSVEVCLNGDCSN